MVLQPPVLTGTEKFTGAFITGFADTLIVLHVKPQTCIAPYAEQFEDPYVAETTQFLIPVVVYVCAFVASGPLYIWPSPNT